MQRLSPAHENIVRTCEWAVIIQRFGRTCFTAFLRGRRLPKPLFAPYSLVPLLCSVVPLLLTSLILHVDMHRSDSRLTLQSPQKLGANVESFSDFPSLSGGPQPTSNAASAWNSNNIRQQQRPPQPQQPPPQQQRASSVATSQHSLDNSDSLRSQQPSGNDWPTSNIQSNSDSFRHGAGITFQQNQQAPIGGQGQQSNPPVHQNGFGTAPMTESPVSASNPQQKPSKGVPNGQPQQQDKPIKRYADMDEEEKWGLAGLTAAFEARKAAERGEPVDETLPPTMRSALFMGQDLQSLGMDLDSAEPMYNTFTPFPSAISGASAYDFHDRHIIPDFTLPAAYTVTNVPPIQQRIGVFSDGESKSPHPPLNSI